jgi:chromosomal replication initiation ATPase DnaA
MAEQSSQLPLKLIHPPAYDRESFIVGAANSEALALVERWPDWPSRLAVLSGPSGSGKTYLTHIWMERSQARLSEASELARGVGSIGECAAVAVEDIDPDRAPEQALFHLINSVREAGGSLLLTSKQPSASWRLGLADLKSRMRTATSADLKAPDDDLLRKLLVKLFADRQLFVEKTVIDYLLLRMERSLKAAVATVEALDHEALAAGRSITRPMAARILAQSSEEPEGFADLQ